MIIIYYKKIENKIYSGDAARAVSAAVTRTVAKTVYDVIEDVVITWADECIAFIEEYWELLNITDN